MNKALKKIGRNAYECVKEMVAALDSIENDEARERILEDALSCEVRSDWHTPGDNSADSNGQFCLLLSTGGPAVRIIGELTSGEPTKARLEVQDWGTPWTEYVPADEDVLLAYARCFWFGEG